MPRTARTIDPTGGIYHVICRGNNKAVIFHDADDHLSFLSIVAFCKREKPFALYHYVLMNNHVHLLLAPAHRTPLSALMKEINQRYSLHYKKKYGFIGHLWQDRFKSKIIEDDAYLLTCGAYIELNPVRARIVSHPQEYQWSSYRHYALGETNHLVDQDILYESFGRDPAERQWRYKDFVRMWQNHPPLKDIPTGDSPRRDSPQWG